MRRNRRATPFRSSTLPGLDPGITVLEVLERAVVAEVVDVVEPAGARPGRSRVGDAEPGRVARGRTHAGEVELPVADDRLVRNTRQPVLPPAGAEIDPDNQAVPDQFDHLVGDRPRCLGRVGEFRIVHDLRQPQVGPQARQLQVPRGLVVLEDGIVAAIVRRNWLAAPFRSGTLPGLDPGLLALDVPEGTVTTELVDVVEPAGARPLRTRVGDAEPGRVPLVRAHASEVQLPVAFQRTQVLIARTFRAEARDASVRRCSDGLAEFTAHVLVGDGKGDIALGIGVGYLSHRVPAVDLALHLGADVVDEDNGRHEGFGGGEVDPDGLTRLDDTIRLHGDDRQLGWYAVLEGGLGQVVVPDVLAAATCGQQKQTRHGQDCAKATGQGARERAVRLRNVPLHYIPQKIWSFGTRPG